MGQVSVFFKLQNIVGFLHSLNISFTSGEKNVNHTQTYTPIIININ